MAALSLREVLASTSTSLGGRSQAEAERRLAQYGRNELQEAIIATQALAAMMDANMPPRSCV